ncbi:MAG: phage integrase N-terminal SAM-like domain-containing protein, partial [Desulfobacteraceae bacterium]
HLKLMDQVRQILRYHHYSYRTEQTYCAWISRYIKYHGCEKHPAQMGKNEIESFLSHLAVDGKVSASTQKQALNSVVFMYKNVLDLNIEDQIEHIRAKKRKHLPVVMTKEETKKVLSMMSGTHLLMAKLMYGSGLNFLPAERKRMDNSVP